jgi:cytoskeletal protein RodZ
MSRIGSSSGVRVASAPLSNVYTVMLLLAALVLVLVLAVVWVTNNQKYGVIIPVSEEGKTAFKKMEDVKASQAADAQKLQGVLNDNLKAFKPDAAPAEGKAEATSAVTPTSTDAAATPTGTDAVPAVAPTATTPAATATPAATETPAVTPTPAAAATSTEAPAVTPTGSAS